MAATLDMTLDGLIAGTRELLLTTAASPDHWDDDRLRRRVNEAAQWTYLQLLAVFQEWETALFSTSISGASQISLPPDFIREVSFEKQRADGSWYQVRILRPNEASGYVSGEEVWVTERGKLVTPHGESWSGSYRMRYIHRLADMINPADQCQIPAEYREVVCKRAATVEAYAAGENQRAVVWDQDLERWRADIEKIQGFLKGLRPSSIEPQTTAGSSPTLAEIRERVRALLTSVIPEPSGFTDLRINYVINEAQLWVQTTTLRSAIGQYEIASFEFTMDGSSYSVAIPSDFLTDIQIDRLEDTSRWEQQRMVSPDQITAYDVVGGRLSVWSIAGGKLTNVGVSPVSGKFRLRYVARVPDLVSNTDRSRLPVFLVQGVALRAAYILTIAAGGKATQTFGAELSAWSDSIPQVVSSLAAFRSRTTHRPGSQQNGTLGQVREEVRATLQASSQKPADTWNDRTVDLAIRHATVMLHQQISLSHAPFYTTSTVYESVSGIGAKVDLPSDYFREISWDELDEQGNPSPMMILRAAQHTAYRSSTENDSVRYSDVPNGSQKPWVFMHRSIKYVGYGTLSPTRCQLVYMRTARLAHLDEDPVDVPPQYIPLLVASSCSVAARMAGDGAAAQIIGAQEAMLAKLLADTVSKHSASERKLVREVVFYGDG